MDLDNVGTEQDYRFPRRNIPPLPNIGERIRTAIAMFVMAPLGAYLFIVNILLRLP